MRGRSAQAVVAHTEAVENCREIRPKSIPSTDAQLMLCSPLTSQRVGGALSAAAPEEFPSAAYVDDSEGKANQVTERTASPRRRATRPSSSTASARQVERTAWRRKIAQDRRRRTRCTSRARPFTAADPFSRWGKKERAGWTNIDDLARRKGEVVITNDGATILKQMEVSHPTAKMLVDLSKSQDIEAGDGTTTVTVIAGALLNAGADAAREGIHPTVISESFLMAAKKSEEILQAMSVPVDLADREQLIRAASTSLNSKVISNNADLLAPLAVDAILKIIDPATAVNCDLRDIKVVKKMGGTIDDTELVDGLVFAQKAPRGGRAHQGCERQDRARAVLPVGAEDGHRAEHRGLRLLADGPHPQGGAQVHPRHVQEDPEERLQRPPHPEVDPPRRRQRPLAPLPREDEDPRRPGHPRSLARRRAPPPSRPSPPAASPPHPLLTDIERDEIEFISKTCGCLPIANIDSFHAEKLGKADLVEEVPTGDGKSSR